MKIKLIHASERRKLKVRGSDTKMTRIVKKFINGTLLENIMTASHSNVNVEVPFAAYENLPKFYRICDTELKKLGYTSGASHDGGGMYNTLFVTWDKS